MYRTKLGGGVVYYLTEDEDRIFQEFLAKYAEGKVTPEDLSRLCTTLTGHSREWDPNHDQDAECARPGCGHTYERHFDTYEDMNPVGCKYCGPYACDTFVEPTG